ncbi:unnamed protein product [Arctia plantaginis]|uniref:Uncharacterized protein n=1 Tax=Arctia plantaginis TaxID=874455 RepID=A0A8S1BEG0_ARCPL|nr:unnamed protein product [Arctia plantaginis]
MHSMVVTSNEETESSEEVLNRIRKAMDAKEGWIKVERVRKAKDRKVVLGFSSREEREKARERIATPPDAMPDESPTEHTATRTNVGRGTGEREASDFDRTDGVVV